jgi:hypothetical protein
VDNTASNPDQADDLVADRGRQLDRAARICAQLDHHETDDGRQGDGIEDGGAAPDVADGSHDTGDRNRR